MALIRSYREPGIIMNGRIQHALDLTRTRVAETSKTLRARREALETQLRHRTGEWVSKGRELQCQVRRDADLRLGKLRDTGLDRAYDLGATTLAKAAVVVEKLPVVSESATQLRAGAEQLQANREELSGAPIDGYDGLNVAEVKAALVELSAYQREKVRAYESANKNRVTVLREIDRLAEGNE